MSKSPFFDYVGKNYAPSAQEISHIKALLQTQQAILDEIDQEIHVLKERRYKHAQLVEEYTALLSPIHRVPTDILSSIFFACVPDVEPFAPVTISGNHPIFVISNVSQRWRQITLNYPRLWALFNVAAPPYPFPPYQHKNALSDGATALYHEDMNAWVRKTSSLRNLMELWITRSAQCSLSFHAVFRDFRNSHSIATLDNITGSIAPIIGLLRGTSERWKQAEFKLEILTRDSPLWSILELDCTDVPLLETFRIDVIQANMSPVKRQIEEAASGMTIFQAPSLHSITLAGVWVPILTIRAQWSTITELNLGESVRGTGGNLGVRDAIEIFKSFPNLIKCALTLSESSRADPTGNPLPQIPPLSLPLTQRLPLPLLTSMSIRGPLPRGLASSLHLPLLDTLFLVGSSHLPRRENDSSVAEWIRDFGDALADVTLDHSVLTQSALLYCLERLPNVVTLRLLDSDSISHFNRRPPSPTAGYGVFQECAVVNSSLLHKLGTKLDEGGLEAPLGSRLCPKLQRFGCRMSQFEFSERALLEFIVNRRGVRSNRKEIPFLKSVVVRFGSSQRIDLRSELEEMNIDMENFLLVESYNGTTFNSINPFSAKKGLHRDIPPRDRYIVHPILPPGVF